MAKKFDRTILIDADAAAISGKSGIGYYTAGLLTALADHAPKGTRIIAHYFNFLGRNKPILPERRNITYKQSRLMPRQLANLLRRLGLPLPYELLTRTRADFIIFPNFLRRSTFLKTPYAATIHDLTYLELSEYVSKRNQQDLEKLVPKTISDADFIMALSETMAKKIKRHYPWYKNPIVTELLPVAKPNMPKDSEKLVDSLKIANRYILFMGNLEPRKNISNLVSAYRLLPEKLKKEYALVLAGGTGWNNRQIMDDIKLAQENGLEIIATGYVTEKQRAALYANASLFAFVSSYEGYGLPVLEAMSYKVPVIASDIDVLREIAGDAALFCNPENAKEIAKALVDGLTNNRLRDTLVKRGAAVTSRSWDEIAEKIWEKIEYKVT